MTTTYDRLMRDYVRRFVSLDGQAVDIGYGEMVLACERVNAKAAAARLPPPLAHYRRQLLTAAQKNRERLNTLAQRTAGDATASIRRVLKSTATGRPPTGSRPGLANLITSRPILPNTGSVGVAHTPTLNKAINSETPGYGPYWRAQEYGTGTSEVPSQLRRVIVGFFYGTGVSGAGSRPQAIYRGGGGPHPIFIPGSVLPGPRGSVGGKGTIGREIQGRHFIRDGADAAAVKWKREMAKIAQRGASELARATVAIQPPRARRP